MTERMKARRYAICTRKSTDEGLDQAYNSLDAQRDACAAYIMSQKHEGWLHVSKHYDDGGFSDGSLDHPALQTLFADLANGEVDIIVVYKIDRLTRSLADFAKLTELFDKHLVSFAAVTQQFNTSTSMGRLTLNVLLSFAQFEREVAGNRLQPTHCSKKGRKYHYYVSAPMIRDAKANPGGFRIPAPDLEKIVIGAIASKLRGRQWLLSTFNLHADASGFGKLTDAATVLATVVEHQPTIYTGILNRIVGRIEVSKRAVKVSIDIAALHRHRGQDDIGAPQVSTDMPCVDLVIAGQFLRCGKEVRLVIGNGDENKVLIDKRLIHEIVQARRWFEDLVAGRASGIADLARRSA